MRKRFKSMLCIGLACAVMQTTACALLPQEEVLPDAPVMRQDKTEEFEMAYVQRGDLVRTQRFTVKYRAVRQEKLSFEVDGLRIENVYVKQGDSVRAGQVLMELEQEELAQRRQDAEDKCDRIEMQLEQAVANREMSRDEYELQLKYMDADELEEAETMEEYLRDQERAIEKLEDDLALAGEEAQQVRQQIRQRQLVAGISGAVTFVRSVAPDDLSSVHNNMVTISDSESSMFVVETAFVELFPEGMQVDVVLNQTTYPCSVVSAQEAGAEGVEEAYLKADIPTAELSDGDSGYLMLETERYDDVLYVDAGAVKTMNGQAFVYVQGEDGLRTTKQITIGHELSGYTEVLSGLEEGDQVILR